ncbi:MAG: hypothetical protein IKS19_07580 [Clostridia bacterium]|nr:hypothetical protein [Clostridia bacterium]
MKTTMIEDIYFNLLDEYESAEDSDFVKQKYDEFYKFLGTIKDWETKSKFEDAAVGLSVGSGASGFAMGFKYALSLLNECRSR